MINTTEDSVGVALGIDKTQIPLVRVLLVDNHTILRQGLRRVLEEQEWIEVCGEASDGREAIERAQALDPDLILMDLAMPGLNGLDATKRILKARPRAKILVLSMYLDAEYVEQALDSGVRGYVLKSASPQHIVDAVRTVASGQRYFAPEIPQHLLERIGDGLVLSPRRAQKLTHREREVVKLLAEGHTVKEAAKILGLSQKTVDTHKTNLMKKLDIHNRVELVRYAIGEKLIQL
ncbi:response regulator [Planctomycetota bacterium]